MNIWRSLTGSVVDRSMLGLNDDVTCFGPILLERERPLGADNHNGLCLILQTLIHHFRWSQRSLSLVGLLAWCIILNLFFFFFGGINCAFYLSIWVYGCMDWVTRIWATQGKRFSLCFLRKAVEEGWGVESKTGKKEGTWERRCEGTTYWMNKWIKEDVYRQLFRDEKRECECLGCIKTEICYRLQFETWYLINARPNTSRFCFFVFFSDSF